MSAAVITGDTKPAEPEKPKLTPEQQKVYDERVKRMQEGIDFLNKQKQTNLANFPQIFTPQYELIIDETIKDFKKLTEENPTLTDQEINKKFEKLPTFENFMATAFGGFYNLYLFKFLGAIVKTNADTWLLAKKITEAQKKKLDAKADEIQKYYDSITDKTPLGEMNKQYNEFRDQLNQLYKEAKVEDPLLAIKGNPNNEENAKKYAESILAFTKNIKVEEKKIAQVKTAERASFSPKRLMKDSLAIMGTTIGSLLIVMLFLVSGMLCANDAIGREVKYRIFYFIYGGLGFPIMLIYYLFRWFTGTAPTIYRLLPIFNSEADTSLARFFLYPFTYKEDQAALDAAHNFIKTAAELVGKKAPAVAAAAAAMGFAAVTEGLEKLEISKEAAAAVEAAGEAGKTIGKVVESLEELQISKQTSQGFDRVVNALKNLPVSKDASS